jgi:hypothetical protein
LPEHHLLDQVTTNAPAVTPQMLPILPRMTMARTVNETQK